MTDPTTTSDIHMTDVVQTGPNVVSVVTETGPATAAPTPTSSTTSTAASATSAATPAAPTANESKKAAGKNRDWLKQKNDFSKRPKNDRGWTPKKDGGDEKKADVVEGDDSGDEKDGEKGGADRPGKKRKVAMAVMYRGTAYFGLQLQNGDQENAKPTVERELMDAIYKAGGISKENMNDTQKIKWMRAARTDKGVHAAGNIMSLMLVPEGPPPPDCISQSPDITERINANLPEDIRVIDWCRTLNGFHAKYACASRVYEYIIPSFVFEHDPEIVALMHETDFLAEASSSTTAAPFNYPERLLNYRLTAEKKASLRHLMSHFKGTLNYQNFTRRKGGFLKDQTKERPKWKFIEDGPETTSTTDAASATASTTTAATTPVEPTPTPSPPAPSKKSSKEKEDGSDDEGGEGLDDAEEEALERAQFISPFQRSGGREFSHVHKELFSRLKASNSSKGGQTNKVSGQYARFIRYIMDFDVESTYLYTYIPPTSSTTSTTTTPPPSLELVRFRIHGQSFILNQIRKMIGLLIIVARGQLPESYITEKAFKYDEYSIPTAPSLGLLLQRPVYDSYDAKVAKMADRPSIESLFLSAKNKPRVDAFREQWIYRQIGDAEVATASAYHWCSRLWDNPAIHQQAADERKLKEEQEEKEKAAAAAAASQTNEPSPMVIDESVPKVEQTVEVKQ